jgi:hypothetical protein
MQNQVLTKVERNRDGERTVEESFGGCIGLETDETEALLAVSPANDARTSNRLDKKKIHIAQRAKGASYPVATLRVLTVARKKSHRLHHRKRLSRYKKEKSQSTFSKYKRVAGVVLRTCAPQPRGRAAMIAGTKA